MSGKKSIFLSWSGPRSKAAAEAFQDWIPQIIQNVKPFYSPNDIEKGARWSEEIRTRLESIHYGLIFLTPENQHAPWIQFEAGALSKLDRSRVVPFALDMRPTDVTGPLSQLQVVTFTKEDIFKLVREINLSLADLGADEKALEKLLDSLWPELERDIQSAIATDPGRDVPRERDSSEILDEILERVRKLESIATDGSRVEAISITNGLKYRLSKDPNFTASSTSIFELPLSDRIKDVLSSARVLTLQDLLKMSFKDLLLTPNMGKRSVNEIEAFLDSIEAKHSIRREF
jgi:hypothetical protein